MAPHRSLRALLVDVPATHARALQRALAQAGWQVRAEAADGAGALTAALRRREWDAVLYAGDGPGAVPARKALALVRLADPHLPFLAVSPWVRAGDLAAVIRGLDADVPVVPDPSELASALSRALDAARLRRRVGGAHRLLLAQQAVTDAIAAGLEPDELSARVLATLGDSLGWSAGAVWRPGPDGALRCAGTWHASAQTEAAALARASAAAAFAPGQGLPGRVYAFRRPSWVRDLGRDGADPRAAHARRAGLMTALAFPIADGDRCAGVIEFFARGVSRPNDEVAAMFATVGHQLARYLERRRHERDAAGGQPADAARRLLDATGSLVAVLDGAGRIRLAGTRTCTALGRDEGVLLGAGWLDVAVPPDDRERVAAALASAAAGAAPARIEHALAGRPVRWRAARVDGAGDPLVLLTGEPLEVRGPGPETLTGVAGALQRALGAGELVLHWQPLHGLSTGALVGLEALVRWQHPQRGLVPPAEFIPIAERTGVIEALGDWVLAQVCAQQVTWAARGLRPHLSFNVSPSQLRRPDFVARVAAQLEASGADPARLTVELTESSTLEDPATAEPLVRDLHALGLRIALDDFGSGYSSLSRLRELPVTTLKIDRAFMRDVPERPEAAAVVTAILSLARALGRTAVAEGVESEAQRGFLAEQGCPLAQGFLFGPPAPADEVEALMLEAQSVRVAP